MTSETTDVETSGSGQDAELKRVLGPGLLLLFIVGDILGAGIYAVTGKLAGQVGGIAWLPFLVAFAVATLTAYSYLELVTKYPQAAGAALYTHKAFGIHFVTFLVAFTVVCSGITSASTSANLLANNLLLGLDGIWEGVPTSSGWALVVALAFMLLLAAVNLRGVGESVKFNVILTLVEMLALAIVIAIGVSVIAKGDSEGGLDRLTVFESPGDKGLFMAVTIATAIAFFSMVGFEDSVNMVEETKDPERIFPRMMLTGLGIAVVIYMLVAISVVIVIPEGDILKPTNEDAGILIDVVKKGTPESFDIDAIYPFLTVFAVANTALINMLMASRLIYGMSRQKVLPPFLGKVLPSRRTPYAAVAFTTALALALIIAVVALRDSNIESAGEKIGVVSALSGTTATLLLAVFAIVNVACLVLRREPDSGHFKAPTVVPVLGAICCLYLLGPWARLPVDRIQYLIAGFMLLLGVVLWAVTRALYKPEGGQFADIEHMDVDPTDDPR